MSMAGIDPREEHNIITFAFLQLDDAVILGWVSCWDKNLLELNKTINLLVFDNYW